MANRIEAYAAKLREQIATGLKPDGTPMGDLDELERNLAVSFEEHFAFQSTQAWAHASGLLSTDEAATVYQSLGEVRTRGNGGWRKDVDLAMKVTVTNLMGELLAMKTRARQPA